MQQNHFQGDRMRYMFVSLLAVPALVWPATATADNYATQSRKVLCAVTPDSTLTSYGPDVVACQGAFTQAPQRGAGAVTTAPCAGS